MQKYIPQDIVTVLIQDAKLPLKPEIYHKSALHYESFDKEYNCAIKAIIDTIKNNPTLIGPIENIDKMLGPIENIAKINFYIKHMKNIRLSSDELSIVYKSFSIKIRCPTLNLDVDDTFIIDSRYVNPKNLFQVFFASVWIKPDTCNECLKQIYYRTFAYPELKKLIEKNDIRIEKITDKIIYAYKHPYLNYIFKVWNEISKMVKDACVKIFKSEAVHAI